MKKKNLFHSIIKTVLIYSLALCMFCASVMPVSADLAPEEVEQTKSTEEPETTEQPEEAPQPEQKPADPLLSNDTFIYVDMYSVEAREKYVADFFLRNNSLYVEKETLLKMAPLVEYTNQAGDTIGFARRDVENAVFDVELDEYFKIKDRTYFPFIEAMGELCIDTAYNRKYEALVTIPVKSVWEIPSAVESMYDNYTYMMRDWQNAEMYDSETSRVLAQATDIGRKMYALPAAIYDYASGNATYDQYRAALQKVTYPDLDVVVADLQTYKNELKFLTAIEASGNWAKLEPEEEETLTGYKKAFYENHQAASKIASFIGKTDKLFQVEDSRKLVEYYANLENMNESIVHGLALVNSTGSIDNKSLKEALSDIVEINAGDKSMWNSLMEQTGEGLVEVLIGDVTDAATQALEDKGINGTTAEFWVNTMDFIGENFLGQYYTTFQMDSVISATSNLHIQDAARRSFYYYKVLYETTQNPEKKMEALQNMRDTTLIYMVAGHNAWKAMEFDSDLSAGAKPTVEEMAKHIEYLLTFSDNEFSVYEHAQDTKYAISALGDWRDQYIYQFEWDETKGNAIGGLEFAIEGKDTEGLGFLCKKIFSYVYYEQSGLLVGNIRSNSRTDSYTRIVEVLENEGVCEIVIRPGKKGSTVLDAEMRLYTGTGEKEYTKGLDRYLVKESDGTVIYRIPVPLSNDISKGEALPTTRVDSKFDFTTAIDASGSGEQTGENSAGGTGYDVEAVTTNYVPTGPFDGKCVCESELAKYRLWFNTELLYMSPTYSTPPGFLACHMVDGYIGETIDLITWTDVTFEEYYQEKMNLYDEELWETIEYPMEDIKEIPLDIGVVKYFVTTDLAPGNKSGTVYCFLLELENGEKIQGDWYPEESKGQTVDTFEAFILEVFSNVEIEAK